MIRFFRNHALMGLYGQHQWWTVQGGSVEYVSRLGLAMRAAAQISVWGRHSGCAPGPTRRRGSGAGREWELFDEVVFATHSDDTLALLSDPSSRRNGGSGSDPVSTQQRCPAFDEAVMPRSRTVWSSWNYTEAPDKRTECIDLTYWMNSLQPWLRQDNLFVTLNSTRPIRQDLIWMNARCAIRSMIVAHLPRSTKQPR